jgi:hypothetical protein
MYQLTESNQYSYDEQVVREYEVMPRMSKETGFIQT